ncbi:branched-chain amino acid transporter permease [Streptomyces paludis]|uniref:Branched-chain amino acid transporter AzlD n=1 Tax=Streptomyces paludis TaxID=2282738 RepID=A0A345HQM0_9ACTN|nr:AzlD domain-containing protein [Streptomyces paludis]AXG78994.1 branched-chain amino acid transporter AzlD [Streptomyces paludis]
MPSPSAAPSTAYLVAVLAIVFGITLALRALPFALLRTLRGSPVVRQLAVWMPVGVLAILAVTALHGTVTADPRGTVYALIAVAVTGGVHLGFGRRTILSVGIGTALYVVLLNAL